MTIISIGSHRFTVVVPSKDGDDDRYIVDVRAFDWNGSCTCRAFTGCARFVLKHQGESRSRESTRCVHIRAAREHVMEFEYPALIERSEKIIELPNSEDRTGYIGL